MLVYVTRSVQPQKASLEVFASLEDAKESVRITFCRIGQITFHAGKNQYIGCTLPDGSLVVTIDEREVKTEPDHL